MAQLRRSTSDTSSSAKSKNNTDLHRLIEKKAYELFQKRGCSHGNHMSDWLQAEKMVKKDLSTR